MCVCRSSSVGSWTWRLWGGRGAARGTNWLLHRSEEGDEVCCTGINICRADGTNKASFVLRVIKSWFHVCNSSLRVWGHVKRANSRWSRWERLTESYTCAAAYTTSERQRLGDNPVLIFASCTWYAFLIGIKQCQRSAVTSHNATAITWYRFLACLVRCGILELVFPI